jgi:hypothetical protein
MHGSHLVGCTSAGLPLRPCCIHDITHTVCVGF